MSTFQTEYNGVLPLGFPAEDGTCHKEVVMRLATAADEIVTQKDPKVQQNPAYLDIVILSRVVIKLGTLPVISTHIIEKLFLKDLIYLKEMYGRINDTGNNAVKATCPECGHTFDLEAPSLGGEE